MAFHRFLSGLIVFMATASASAQLTAQLPQVAVGDTWVYQSTALKTGDKAPASTEKVIAVNSDTITVETNRGLTRTYTREWTHLQTKRGEAVTFISQPGWRAFKFPMSVGESWDSTSNSKQATRTARISGSVRVVGTERITVPAGTFDAMKLETDYYYNVYLQPGGWSGRYTSTSWYAPAVRRVVRTDWVEHSASGYTYHDENRSELLSFTPGAQEARE